MEKQHELLRLVVQKMEIRTEADERDISNAPSAGSALVHAPAVNWSSPLIRRQLTKQAVVNRWSKLKAAENKE